MSDEENNYISLLQLPEIWHKISQEVEACPQSSDTTPFDREYKTRVTSRVIVGGVNVDRVSSTTSTTTSTIATSNISTLTITNSTTS